ncbi:MAG: methylated-DNA--[protein]-cysteine S-methyltransferase [Archangiaceae bacterium]|nr:methylated-DNA--[protein]-cysteine S-methyltransferase [Archangiaceae bacterium]
MSEHAWLKTRVGWWLHLQGTELGITRLDFVDQAPAGTPRVKPFMREVSSAVEKYFAGERTALERVEVAAAGTAFQKQVWAELRKVTFGHFISYAELAERVGRPRGSRAVGQAVAKNPVALIIPCHRVITANGSLGGYAWGRERKAMLLEHEQVERLAPRSRKPSKRAAAAPPEAARLPLPLFEKLGDPTLSLSLAR